MSSKNNTNVRSKTLLFLRWGLKALEGLSPLLAAAAAERLFRSPPSRKRSAPEKAMLAEAERFHVGEGQKRIEAWRWGHGPSVLLVHGWGGGGGQLYSFVEPLMERGYSVIAFDAPAHGESGGSMSSLIQFASAIEQIAARVGSLDALIAHSMGGAAASLAMAQGLKVRRAVYVAPPADAYEWLLKFSRLLHLSKKVEILVRRRMERRLGFRFDRLNAWTLGPSIEAPLRVIHDRFDEEVSWMDGATTVAAVAASSPKAELLTTEGLGHRRILKEPKVIREAVRFVAEGMPSEAPESLGADRCSRCGTLLRDSIDLSEGMCGSCELDLELFNPAIRLEHDLHFNL